MRKSRIDLVLIVAVLVAGVSQSFAQTVPPGGKEQVDKMIAVLDSNAPLKEKVEACRGLAVVGTKDAVPALASLLSDEQLSHMARYALEPIPDPAVDDALRSALGKLKGRLLAGAIGSIGVRRDAKAVEPLAKLLQDSDPDVVQAAARSLGSIATPEAAKALKDALSGVQDANRPALCEGLFRAAEALGAKGRRDEAVAIYDKLRTLQTAPHQVRAGALRGAILARGQDGLTLLREHLKGKDYVLFAAAVRASQEIRGPEVTKALTDALASSPADNQIVLLQTLGTRRDGAATPAVLAAAKTGDKRVRLAAVRAVAELDDPAAATPLLGLMEDGDREIAEAARDALAAMPGQQIDEAVIAMLRSGETARRLLALELIGQRRIAAAVPVLLNAANDPDAGVQAAVVKRLGELAGPAELPAMVDLLMRSKSPKAVNALEEALSTACVRVDRPEACAGNLAGVLARAEPAQKNALVRVLGKVGGATALKAIQAAVNDSDKEVRTTAIRTLSAWKTPEVLPGLLALAQQAADPTDKRLALRGLISWAANAKLSAQIRLCLCGEIAKLAQDTEEKKLLLSALGNVALADAIASIMPYVADSAVKDEACAAAVSVAEKLLKGDDAAKSAPKLIEPLKKVAEVAGDRDVAQRAKEALSQAQGKAGGK